jgi:hypothetical protein
MIQRVPTFMPTKDQRDWLEAEKKKTGNAFSVILKGLIQKEIDHATSRD